MSTTTPKQLGQTAPTAATNTTNYTTPAATATILSSICICNTSSSVTDKVRVFIIPSAGAAGVTNAIIFDLSIPANNPYFANIAVTMNTGGFIQVYSLNGTSTFTTSGAEIS
jgi:hypothetical protein